MVLGVLIWMLGFSLPFPGLLLPGQTFSPRYTDLLVVGCIPFAWSLYNRTMRGGNAPAVCALWLAAAIVSAVVQMLLFGGWGVADFTYYFRWVVAILLAAPLAWAIPERRDLQMLFLAGIVTGAVLHLASIWVAMMGGTSFLRSVGFASARVLKTAYNGETRVTSLAEHPNGAMILLALSVPAAMAYRLLAPPNRGYLPMVAAFATLIFGFYFTLTRSATLAAVAATLVALLQFVKRSDKFVMYFRAAFIVLALLVLFLAFQISSYQVGQDRLMERMASKGLSQNLEGRADTFSATIDILMSYPLGVGWSKYLQMGSLADHLSASHNGYLFTARVAGIPIAILLLLGHVRLLWRTASTRRIDALPPVAVFLIAVMFAEDVTQGMSLVFLSTFIAMCGLQSKPWASAVYRSVLVPPAVPLKRSPGMITGRKPIE